ncbi:hypothetical protein GLIP_3114 [Aliiglaciecola lipolytica E3]|uniref:Flagellar hook-length control protein-like C-terminal domain-containing protein n=2 Tax=Aliiglaciecola TaxID=1406885 RepID=K6YWX7_9ALTE|nr:hypothetical protein GLIP_3114 [Aliiglaciecola lipolytica E3]
MLSYCLFYSGFADKLFMSDISLNSQQQLVQALAQLSKLSNNSPVAKQAAQVIVQFLANNQISLSLPRQQQSITLPKPNNLPAAFNASTVQAQLQNQTSSSGNQNATSELVLFSNQSKAGGQTLIASLSQKQFSSLLNAISTLVSPGKQAKPQLLEAKVVNIDANTASLSVQINAKSEIVKAQIPIDMKDLKINQLVQLQVIPKGNQWQVRLIADSQSNAVQNSHSSSSVDSKNNLDQLSGNDSKKNQSPTFQTAKENTSGAGAITKESLVNLAKADVIKLLQSDSARLNNPANNLGILVPRQPLIDTLTKQPQLLQDNILAKLLQINPSVKNINIDLLAGGKADLKGQVAAPIAQIPLTQEQVKQVQTILFTGNDKKSSELISQPSTSVGINNHAPKLTTDKANNLQNSKDITLNIPQTDVASLSKTWQSLNSKLDAMPVEVKQQVLTQINELIRRVLPQAVSPSETLQNIEIALRDPTFTKSPESKVLAETILKQIQQGLPQGKEADAENIKQIMSQTPLNLSPLQLTQGISSQGIVAGLMTMLQITLASRLNRNQPQSGEKIAQIVTSLISGENKPAASQTQRSLNDLNQMEQKHQLLKQLGRMFAQHQFSKLNNAEQALQGQETFYYVLPSGTGEQKKDIELLIKREPEKQNTNEKQHNKDAIWHLTMKMDIGEIGQILTKAKLQQEQLELDLYTSNDAVKNLVFEYLPLFKKRLKSLGIEVSKAQCQLGKIPEHLQTRPYQIFETQA